MAALPPGAEIAGFRIVGVAGRGGMGVVYRATQPGLGRVVALKVVADGLLDDPRARARFLRESRAAAAIEHPHVIPIHAAGEEEGTAYLAMRYVSGPDLLRLVGDVGPLAPARAVRLIADLASALDAAHASGLVHRTSR
jgi:serine/threonine protein kinase